VEEGERHGLKDTRERKTIGRKNSSTKKKVEGTLQTAMLSREGWGLRERKGTY